MPVLVRSSEGIVDTEHVECFPIVISTDCFYIYAQTSSVRLKLGHVMNEPDIDKIMVYMADNKYREMFISFDQIKGILEIDVEEDDDK